MANATADVAAELESDLRLEEILLATTTGYLLDNPNPTAAEFREWNTRTQLSTFHPEVLAVGAAAVVSGEGPLRCVTAAELIVDPAFAFRDGVDLCSVDTVQAALVESRDTGLAAYRPYSVGESEVVFVLAPVYRDGVAPSTVGERRAALIATVIVVVDPDVLLADALARHPELTAASLSHQQDVRIDSSIGSPPNGARALTTELANGWEVTTFGSVASTGVLDNADALAVLLLGVLISGLIGAIVFFLGAGRERATSALDRRTDELHHQALHDVLTGLPNRVLIMDRLEQLVLRSRRRGTNCAALVIELDGFRNVNDTLGPATGDQLLVAVARRIEDNLSDVDTFGRLGCDEFVILIDGTASGAGPTLLADRLLKAMRHPFVLDNGSAPIQLTVSVGIAVGVRNEPADLLRDAANSALQAQASGKNRSHMFDPTDRSLVEHRRNLELDLRSAIRSEQFTLVYQPVYALRDLSLVGFETLLRWQHPTLGLVEPWEFIPILEQNGQIADVGRWALRQACEQMAHWHTFGHPLSVSVNVSSRQLEHSSIIDDVRVALQSSGLDPASLTIEVPESALTGNVQQSAQRLEALQKLGVKIVVDDFGTGYSSLACLQQFPTADLLKIDRSFVQAIGRSEAANTMITTLVQLGRTIGIDTLAEGVETVEQLVYLRSQQVTYVQGFMLSRPLDVSAVESTILAPFPPSDSPRTSREPAVSVG